MTRNPKFSIGTLSQNLDNLLSIIFSKLELQTQFCRTIKAIFHEFCLLRSNLRKEKLLRMSDKEAASFFAKRFAFIFKNSFCFLSLYYKPYKSSSHAYERKCIKYKNAMNALEFQCTGCAFKKQPSLTL